MRKTVFATLLLAAAMAAPMPALAWDYVGHRIVGAVADAVLKQHHSAAYRRVNDLLDKKDADGFVVLDRRLSQVAVYPDCAKDEEEFCGRKPTAEEIAYVLRNLGHEGYHYTNSPLEEDAYKKNGVGATDTDLIQMINYTVLQLKRKNPFKFGVKLSNTEALWLLAHLVGDVHQPLHVGQPYYDKTCQNRVNPNGLAVGDWVTTRGANSIKFESTFPAITPAPSLHIYWDAITIARAMHAKGYAGDEAGFARMLAMAPPTNWKMDGEPETWVEKWYSEGIPLARLAAPPANIAGKLNDRGECEWTMKLDPAYETWAQDIATQQLAKAGFRLAALLAAIFSN